jgi:DNA-damage-inducible protein D
MSDEEMGLALVDDEGFDAHIRRTLHDGRLFFSVIDVVGALTGSAKPRRYWTDMKRRLAEDEGFTEVYALCVQLKLRSSDGKSYLTDCADIETLLRIIQSVPSPRAEPLKQWLARVGSERIAEVQNPALGADQMRRLYRQQGYSDDWIQRRLENIVVRNDVTAEWAERGAEEGREFALLTDVLNKGTFELTTGEHKAVKGLKPRHNLRDSMTPLELVLTSLAETTAATFHQQRDSQGFMDLQRDAHQAGGIAGDTRERIEAATGQPVVSPENYKTLQQGRQRDLQPSLFDAPAPTETGTEDKPQE